MGVMGDAWRVGYVKRTKSDGEKRKKRKRKEKKHDAEGRRKRGEKKGAVMSSVCAGRIHTLCTLDCTLAILYFRVLCT